MGGKHNWMNSLSAAGSKVWLSRLGRRCLQGSPRGLQPSRRQGSLPQTPLDEAQAGGAGSPDRSMVGDGVSVPALPTPRGAREETDPNAGSGRGGDGGPGRSKAGPAVSPPVTSSCPLAGPAPGHRVSRLQPACPRGPRFPVCPQHCPPCQAACVNMCAADTDRTSGLSTISKFL